MRLRESPFHGYAAIKSVKADAPIEEHQGFLREASTMAQFDHENVIRLHGMILGGCSVLFVVETYKSLR